MSAAVCRYCTHLTHRDPGTPTGRAWEPLEWACMHKLEVRPGRHHCDRFEREPGVDDDLERTNAAGIASKASESAYEARSGVYQSRSAS
jgi:hypothetical protein